MINIPEDDLRRLYIDEKKTIVEISRIYGCGWITIKKRLNKYEIPIRSNDLFSVDDYKTLNSKMKFKIGIGTGLSINENK